MDDQGSRLAIPAGRLWPALDRLGIPSSTTEVGPLEDVFGQERARQAIAFGLTMTADGYHVAVSGPRGSGRTTAVRLLVDEAAKGRARAPDWVYVHNFAEPHSPRAVALPSGTARVLQRLLVQLADACRTALPKAFDADSYQARAQEVLAPVAAAREQVLQGLSESARRQGFGINPTPAGLLPVPLGGDGAPLAPETFQALPEEARQAIEARVAPVQEQITAALRELRRLDREARELVERVDDEVMRFVVGPMLDELRQSYSQYGLGPFLEAVQRDIAENLEVYKRFTEPFIEQVPPYLLTQATEQRDALLRRYAVNVFSTQDEGDGECAPAVFERHPAYQRLFGRMDFENRMGTLVTDFGRLQAGSVQRANGGFLVLNAEELLAEPYSWVKLKQALKTKEARVEGPGAGQLPIPVVDLVPAPIPLDLKVVLIGETYTYALLDALDPDFPQLFKIRAEFEPDTDLDASSAAAYVRFVRRTCDGCKLRPFDAAALANVIAYGARLAGRQDRLTTRYGLIGDLCEEAAGLAAAAGAGTVGGEHVEAAIEAKRRRSGLVADRLRRMIAEGALHIETSGSVTGQVNGLAVYSAGSHAFGTPTRITCRVGLGQRGVVAIERETEHSGAIHSKGVLVLSGYLLGTFGRDRQLAFNASITFEQTYDEVEGDSASTAELCGILTALAEVPVRQDIAVTGSVDQFGNIQPVGGVTEKVEGFFDVCREAGMTGSQGVILPAANVVNLTLRPDVVRAAREGQFHLWAVKRVEEVLELLTGVEAGTPGPDGRYPPLSLFASVWATLDRMAEAAHGPEGARRRSLLSPER